MEQACEDSDLQEDEIKSNSNNFHQKGRPPDSCEVLEKKKKDRVREISFLRKENVLLKKQLDEHKMKTISERLYELVEDSDSWKEKSNRQNRSLTTNAEMHISLLQTNDNVSTEKVPIVIRNVIGMLFGSQNIDTKTSEFLSTSCYTAKLALDRVADTKSRMIVDNIISDNVQSMCLIMDETTKHTLKMKCKALVQVPSDDTQPVKIDVLHTDDAAAKKGKIACSQTCRSLHNQLGPHGLSKINGTRKQ